MKNIDRFRKILRVIILMLIVIIGIYVILFVLPKRNSSKNSKETDKVLDYVLYEKDTELYKEIFSKLKEELSKNTIDYEKYAEYISELFIIDLYSLSNKVSKDDVGGKIFVLESIRDNFQLNVSNTLYKYIGLQNDKPEVSSIELETIDSTTYKVGETEYDGYKVSLNWTYKEDNDYDKKGNVVVIHSGDRLYVVEKNNE